MNRFGIFMLILLGLFYFSEGKPCPERTRPHKTRCEVYFKCRELPSKMHVWVPEKCDQGLVYEHDVKMCVLPGDDWECTLGDSQSENGRHKKFNIIESSAQVLATEKSSPSTVKESEVYILNNSAEKAAEDEGETDEGEEENDSEYEASGDGEDLLDDGFIQVENRETEDALEQKEDTSGSNEILTMKPTMSPTTAMTASTSNIDPKLTAHLQRLSQLIDGLKDTYQTKDKDQQELRPDQLNAFLAHFNIKSKFESLNPSDDTNYEAPHLSTTTPIPTSTHRTEKFQNPSRNKTLLQEHLNSKLEPETKVVLTNALPKRYSNSDYTNSQIVVNRPEGSVLFNLPPTYSTDTHYTEHGTEYHHNSPKISEDTLKTVLELSKQMIATQNVPKVIPNPAYYPQPILPLFIAPSGFPPQASGSPFSSYYSNSNSNHNNNNENNYATPAPSYGKLSSHGYKKPSRPNRPNRPNRPSTTIIHNNVIPLHLTSTSSGEKELVDSYGQSLGVYPPLNPGDLGNRNTQNEGYPMHTINHLHHHSHRYENNKYITSVTTVRPIMSTTSSPNYDDRHNPPYPSEMVLTTARPYDYQSTPSTISDYYTPSPHLNNNNVNQLFQTTERYPTIQYNNVPRPIDSRPGYQIETASYASSSSLFPSQIDHNKVKIRPNSQKFESIEEMDTDDVVVGGSYQQQQQQQQQQQSPQILTYNYDNENNGVNNQLSHFAHAEPSSLLAGLATASQKHPYISRPSTSVTGYGGSGSSSSVEVSVNKPKFPTYGMQQHQHSGNYMDGTQLVNVGGNFISFDVFQNSILPLLGGQSQSLNDLNNIEVITCSAGVRQPNTTDCTRYYVCSKKDGKVLSYSCPPYTAFNAQTRICDARTYSICNPEAIISSYTVSENKRIQLEAIKALQEAKRRREQALKAQSIANLFNSYSSAGAIPVDQIHSDNVDDQFDGDGAEKDMLSAYVQQAASMAAASAVSSTTNRPTKKRKYYCKEGDKIADQTSIYSYFVCYKNAQGMMKGHKMTCSKGLVFCPKTTMCTIPSKCL